METLDQALQAQAHAWVAEHRNEIAAGRRNPWTIADGFTRPIAERADAALAVALEEAGLR